MPKWINVKERLPELRRLVIVYDGCCVKLGHLVEWDRTPMFAVGVIITANITHWQEMPKPPSMYTTDGKKVYYKGSPMSPEYTAMLLNLLDCDDKAGEAQRG